jgi:predicted amidohydrolase
LTGIRAASVQFEAAAGDSRGNLAKVRGFVLEAASRGVGLVVFPECCLTGYWFLRNLTRREIEELAEPVPDGPSTQAMVEMAREYGIAIGAGLVERGEDGAFYNSYFVAMPDGRVHRHRKLHAFEHEAIVSGSEYTVFDLADGWRAGILICYDNNIVENVRATALLGADILIAPHQTGGCRTKNPRLMGAIDRGLWERRAADPAAIERELRGEKGRGWLMRWLPSRAHDNGVFLIFSNGVGVDDDEIRTGNAMILDPYGSILAETCKAGDDMVVADLDPALLACSTGRMWTAARRPELYGGLTVRTGRERDAHELKFEE